MRNRRDGAVELLAIGPETALQRLIQACRDGPAGAEVASVEATAAQDDGSQGFIDLPTA